MKTIIKNTLAIIAVITLAMTAGCKKSDTESSNTITLNTTDRHCKWMDTLYIEATSPLPITYSTNSEYHAKFDQDGMVIAGHVGTATIGLTNGSDTKSLKVYVDPIFNYYTLPNFIFGVTTKSQVIAQYGTPDLETGNIIGYMTNDIPKVLMIGFQFENGILESISYAHNTSEYYYHLAFLSERYELVDVSSSMLMFINALSVLDATMAIGLTQSDSFDLTTYISAVTKDSMVKTTEDYIKVFGDMEK